MFLGSGRFQDKYASFMQEVSAIGRCLASMRNFGELLSSPIPPAADVEVLYAEFLTTRADSRFWPVAA
jgi:hypothetical protein